MSSRIFTIIFAIFLAQVGSVFQYTQNLRGGPSVDENGNPITPRDPVVDDRTDAEIMAQLDQELKEQREKRVSP